METRVFATYETATLAKEKGYNEYCEECYTVEEHGTGIFVENSGLISEDDVFWCYRPKQAELQKWLRDVKKIHVNPTPYRETIDNEITGYWIDRIYDSTGSIIYDGDDNYPSYEEALEAGLLIALKAVKD